MAKTQLQMIGTIFLIRNIFFEIKNKSVDIDSPEFLYTCRDIGDFYASENDQVNIPDIAYIYITRNLHGIVTDQAVYEFAGFNKSKQKLSASYKCKAFGLKGGVTELSKRTGVCMNTLRLLFKTKPIVFHSYLEFALRSRGIV